MPNKTSTNSFDIQDMVSTLYNIEEFKKEMPIGIEVSLDFYKTIQNAAFPLDYTKRETIFGLPIKINTKLKENYKFIYNKKEWEDEDAE